MRKLLASEAKEQEANKRIMRKWVVRAKYKYVCPGLKIRCPSFELAKLEMIDRKNRFIGLRKFTILTPEKEILVFSHEGEYLFTIPCISSNFFAGRAKQI